MTGLTDYLSWHQLDYKPAITEHLPEDILPFLARGQRALEVGCSNGSVCLYLAHHGIEVLGVDLNASAIAEAKQREFSVGVCNGG